MSDAIFYLIEMHPLPKFIRTTGRFGERKWIVSWHRDLSPRELHFVTSHLAGHRIRNRGHRVLKAMIREGKARRG